MGIKKVSDRGVIFVATQHARYICESISAAESVKKFAPDLPITLFTDTPKNFLCAHGGVFERIIPLKLKLPAEKIEALAWGRGIFTKIESMIRSPYAKTVYLDSDIRIVSKKFPRIFESLENHSIAMAPVEAFESRSVKLMGPMFGAGVIAYRHDDSTQLLFQRWRKLHLEHLKMASQKPLGKPPLLAHIPAKDRSFLLTCDQTSLSTLLSPLRNELNVACAALDRRWNARNCPRDQLKGVVVDHADCFKVNSHDKLLEFLAERPRL